MLLRVGCIVFRVCGFGWTDPGLQRQSASKTLPSAPCEKAAHGWHVLDAFAWCGDWGQTMKVVHLGRSTCHAISGRGRD